ncbi:MAG: bifunctional diaminohydroxyphosphoribosylaminopyrimidine deaminase/5-amino-6-(5-phosphoribosylamino)uracil reductase RibD [Burkholderiaceae bacterium]|nr:bifunctional diaminohydroxyphosphoribosylaminopyrimidine deaminase/5-amino-6-(5-phosphoribosylamino)uracil reductase RibD [Burkholderiaceae bacterium]
MPIDEHDQRQLQRALELAHDAIGRSDPNPRVGCVLADAEGRVVGVGVTQRAGEPHAEVMALRAAHAAGASLPGGTAWVSLEPCSHHGRTPPCCDALVAARLARVVVSAIDPNPLVSGAGVQRLRDAGIRVDVAEDAPAEATRELNIGFFSRMRRQRPWVRLKVAASLDGRTALADGSSQWITGEAARADAHAWRRRAGAVLTGSGTILADNPRLDVRSVPTEVQPLRVVIDSQLRVPAASRVFDPPGSALVYCAGASAPSAEGLRQRGVGLIELPSGDGHVDLHAMLSDLARRGVNELHVEGGEQLNAALLAADLVDELLLYLAPRLLGPGRAIAALPALARLSDASAFRIVEATRCGDDLRVIARPRDRERCLD